MKTVVGRDRLQFEYFNAVSYRVATDPVSVAYASPKVEFAFRAMSLPQEPKMLDLACGNGIFTHQLSGVPGLTVGIDLSTHLLAQNGHRNRVCGDAHTLPFGDRSFDLVFEANLLHHVPDPAAVIAEMQRVSRDYVVLVEPNRWNPLMLAFSLLVPAERGVLSSSARRLRQLVQGSSLRFVDCMTTGMISQNNTPAFLVPLLKKFDRPIWWGEYVVLIARKQPC